MKSLRILALAGALLGRSSGAWPADVQVIRPTAAITQPENTLVSVKLVERETCAVFCLNDLSRVVDQFRQFGGEFVFTAAPGKYAVLVYGGEVPKPPSIIEITEAGPGPGPGPDPVPPDPVPPDPVELTGLAKDVYLAVRLPGKRAMVKQMGACTRAVEQGVRNALAWQAATSWADRAAVPQPQYFTSQQAAKALADSLKALPIDETAFGAFWNGLFTNQINAVRNDLGETAKIYGQIATGMEVASK